jgi:phage-related protein (TIGR01555 family)
MATKKGIVNRPNSRPGNLTTQRNVRPVRSTVMDTFQNSLARLGSASENIISAATYPLTRLSRNYQLLNSLYRNSWICNKIVNTVPEDMMKNGWALTTDLQPKETDRINKLEQRTLVKEKLLEGLYWGRLYGGAGAIMMIDGHEDKLDEPLDYDDILPGSFCGLMVVDRWSGIYPGLELIKDIRDPEFGMPEFYEVRDTVSEAIISKVHHSRVLRFTGKKLPFWEEMAEIYWGSSVMEHVYEELLKRDSTSWNIASLVFQANLLVDQVEGFNQLQAASDPEMQRNFYNIKSAQNQMRSNNGMMIVGEGETISAINYTFAGLEEISESQMMDISGACDIPMTRLFGRSPAGMNATGESDIQMYTDMIGQQQNKDLRPKLNKLYPVLFMSEFGKIPKDLGIKFNPVSTPTEDKASDTVAKKVESISKAWNDGAISQKHYLTELHELSYSTNIFTSISDKDIARASDDFGGAGEDTPDLGLLGDEKEKQSSKEMLGEKKGSAADSNDVFKGMTRMALLQMALDGEIEAINLYDQILQSPSIEEKDKAKLQEILNEEKQHFAELTLMMKQG